MSRRAPSGPTGQRMFVALGVPDDALEHLEEFLEPRREHGAFRWTDPEQLHLTLAFLAGVPQRRLDDLDQAVTDAAVRATPVTARIAGGGAFPDPAGARVLVARLEQDDVAAAALDRLARGVRAAASHAGVAVDGQRFSPHVTLARLGRPTELTRWVRLLDAYRGPEFTADHVALVASHLGEGRHRRPRYEVVSEHPLAR